MKELNTLTLTSTNLHTSFPGVQDINCEATKTHTQKETLQIYLRYSLSRVGAESGIIKNNFVSTTVFIG